MHRYRGLSGFVAPGGPVSVAGMGASVLTHGVLAAIVMYGGLGSSIDSDAESSWREVIFLAPYTRTPSELRVERVSYVSLESIDGQDGGEVAGGSSSENADSYARDALDLSDSAESESVASSIANDEEVYLASQVEDPAAYDALSAAPHYPDSLRIRNIEGAAIVEFVVDARGRADTLSFRILETSHEEFALAVRKALPRMRFSPATVDGLPVYQLVQIPFVFKIQNPGDSLQSGGGGGGTADGEPPDSSSVTGSGW